MKWIDRLAGVPLCLLASPIAALDRLVRRPCLPSGRRGSLDAEGTRILFVKLLGMGSILLATPTVQAVRRRYPKARLHLVTFASNRAFAENLGIFDEVRGLRASHFPVFAYDVLRWLSGAWRRRYQAVLDFEFFSRFSALLTLACGARRRVGFRSPLAWRGWLLTDDVFFSHYRHITDNFLALARAIGAEPPAEKTIAPMRFQPPDQQAVQQALRQKGAPAGAPLFLVNVNASDMCLERRWPAASYDQLMRVLRLRYPQVWFLFMGAPGERTYVTQVLASFGDQKQIVNIAGDFTLAQLAALMKECRLLITSESGPLHFAQSMDLPSVSLFGPGPPTMFGPLGRHHRTLYAAVECSPCLNYYALTGPTCHGDNICMKRITPEQVEREVTQLLGSLGTRL